MRAAAIDRFDGPAVLKLHSLPVPDLAADEVLIAVNTAGAAGWDAEIRAGWYPGRKPKFPLVLGTDGFPGRQLRRQEVPAQFYCGNS